METWWKTEKAGLFIPVHLRGQDSWSLVVKVKISVMIIDHVFADLNVALWYLLTLYFKTLIIPNLGCFWVWTQGP